MCSTGDSYSLKALGLYNWKGVSNCEYRIIISTLPSIMGNTLSDSDMKELQPHLEGYNPEALTRVVWDAIKSVGTDDKYNCFGIHFEDDLVTYWDSDGLEQIQRIYFLQIIELIGKKTLESCTQTLGNSGNNRILQLELALDALSREISRLSESAGGGGGREDVYSSRDSLSASSSPRQWNRRRSVVELIRVRSGSCSWYSGEEEEEGKHSERQHNRGGGARGGANRDMRSGGGRRESVIGTIGGEVGGVVGGASERLDVEGSCSKAEGREKLQRLSSPHRQLKEYNTQFLTVERQWRDISDYPHRKTSTDPQSPRVRRNSLVGMEGIVERMPQLRSKYEKSLNTSPAADYKLNRVRTKMQSLTFLLPSVKKSSEEVKTSWSSAVDMNDDNDY